MILVHLDVRKALGEHFVLHIMAPTLMSHVNLPTLQNLAAP